VPDFLVDENADGDGLNGLRTREADLAKHLSNDRDKEEAMARHDEVEDQMRMIAMERSRAPLEYGGGDDFQLRQALNHLKGLPLQLSKHLAKPALAHQQKSAKPR
jgi:carboxyl-terminal processing protease